LLVGSDRQAVPKTASKNFHRNIKKSGIFSAGKKHHPTTTLSPAIHHNFTTKNHHETTRFLKNPLKNAPPPLLKKSRT
jgi:hypothetical protein